MARLLSSCIHTCSIILAASSPYHFLKKCLFPPSLFSLCALCSYPSSLSPSTPSLALAFTTQLTVAASLAILIQARAMTLFPALPKTVSAPLDSVMLAGPAPVPAALTSAPCANALPSPLFKLGNGTKRPFPAITKHATSPPTGNNFY